MVIGSRAKAKKVKRTIISISSSAREKCEREDIKRVRLEYNGKEELQELMSLRTL